MAEKSELTVGQVWEAKKPKKTMMGFYDDRQIMWLSETKLQYDSPTVTLGMKYPTISIKKFLAWAGKEITAEMPKDEYWRTERKQQ